MEINVTSGDCLNALLQEKYKEQTFVPFREAMLNGDSAAQPFSERFLEERCRVHGVTKEEYLEKLSVFIDFLFHVNEYDTVFLWFGDEPFCVKNREFVIRCIRQRGYEGRLILYTVDENTANILTKEQL